MCVRQEGLESRDEAEGLGQALGEAWEVHGRGGSRRGQWRNCERGTRGQSSSSPRAHFPNPREDKWGLLVVIG